MSKLVISLNIGALAGVIDVIPMIMKKIKILSLLLLIPFYFYSQNINLSKGVVFDGEPYIAVNPYNSQHLVVAWMGFKFGQNIAIKVKVSFDGGDNWSTVKTLPHNKLIFTSADPSVAFGPEGEIYISFVDFTGLDADNVEGGIYVSKSEDGGLTWNKPIEVMNLNSDPGRMAIDRPWISIDRSDKSTRGNIYITSMNAKGATPPYHPYLSMSSDGGQTFNWKYLDDTDWLSGNSIPQPMPTNTVSNNGTLYAVYPSYVFNQSILPQYILVKSEDGSKHFQYNTVFKNSSTVNNLYAKKGYLLRADPSDNKHLIFLYLTNNNGNIDVACSESFDGGNTWKHFGKINDDESPAIQDMVWGDFNEKGDYLATWRDRRKALNDSYSNPYEFWAAVKYKDSTSFSKNFRISDTIIQFDDLLLKSGNDFMSTAFTDDTLNAVWGDTRNGKLNIWFQKMSISNNTISNTQIISEESFPDIDIYPNPASNLIIIKGNDIGEICIFDLLGRKIKNIKITPPVKKHQITGLEPGTYLFRIKTKEEFIYKRIICGKH